MAMLRIKCPSCGAVQDFDDSWKEQVRKCSACRRDVRIPPAATQPPVTTIAPRARLAPEPIPAVPVRPAPLALSQGLDTSIQKDLIAVGSGEATDLAEMDGKSVLDRDVAAEVRLVEKSRSRRK